VELQLAAEPVAASRARRFVLDVLHQRGAESLSEVAELLVSELVTNALLHARSAMTVRVSEDPKRVRVEVTDASPVVPHRSGYGAEATTGRGLELVDALSSRWGAALRAPGKVVWFELDRV